MSSHAASGSNFCATKRPLPGTACCEIGISLHQKADVSVVREIALGGPHKWATLEDLFWFLLRGLLPHP